MRTISYNRDGIFKESMGARNQGGIGLSYRPARLADFIPWDRFLGFITFKNTGSQTPLCIPLKNKDSEESFYVKGTEIRARVRLRPIYSTFEPVWWIQHFE
jgi:hypothetical protein